MIQREVLMTEEAVDDLFRLDYAIREKFQAPLTAYRYLAGLKKKVQKLSGVADLAVINSALSIKYHKNIRLERYKEMTILYYIEDDKVYVHRIIPQKLVI